MKLLPSRNTDSRKVRFAKVGKSPERKLLCRARVLSWESWFRSEGRFPVRDLEARLMAVTRLGLELSQLIPFHEQKSVPVQLDGAGEMEAASLDMTAASSAVEKERMRRRQERRQRRRRWLATSCAIVVDWGSLEVMVGEAEAVKRPYMGKDSCVCLFLCPREPKPTRCFSFFFHRFDRTCLSILFSKITSKIRHPSYLVPPLIIRKQILEWF